MMLAERRMPERVERRLQRLRAASAKCYARRDRAYQRGLVIEADDFEIIGDIYKAQAAAIVAEWRR